MENLPMPSFKPCYPHAAIQSAVQSSVVSAQQMQQIEQRLFEAGMPVAALMEKVATRLTHWFLQASGLDKQQGSLAKRHTIGVLAGPGHNGGDALVMGRELHHLGFKMRVYQPFDHCKPLTTRHADYARHLGITFVESVDDVAECDAVIDGWFGFGLTRPITGKLAEDIQAINQQQIPVFSIDLPSGIHTDSGQVMGAAIKATRTACLGLWKRGFMQEKAIALLGNCDLIDFDIPLSDISAVLGSSPEVNRLTPETAMACLPLHRSPTAHKYTAGHLLLVAGSRQYAGAALLAGLGAVASGVGMLTLAVPESIRLSLLPQLPGALLLGCEETVEGAIAKLPDGIDLEKYDAIAFGPGLGAAIPDLLTQVLSAHCPILLDADGLNLLARNQPLEQLQARQSPTVLTPHPGEFKRLFPDIHQHLSDALPGESALKAASVSGATILLKGPRSVVSDGKRLWFNPESTAALARGGSGDVLTGLMGGLMASAALSKSWEDKSEVLTSAVLGAMWWHSQAAIVASRERTILGVDPLQLTQFLNSALASFEINS